jgi:hypothetical protein
MNKDQLLLISKAYYKFLKSIDWKDEILQLGLHEGLLKFLSNAYLGINETNKYFLGDYYSKNAIRKINAKDFSGLIFEHMVPKQEYIQNPCIEKAKNNLLTEKYIIDLMKMYWKIAVITKIENSKLASRKMPDTWDGRNIFCRYENAKVKLIPVNDCNFQ